MIAEEYVNFITSNAVPKAMTIEEIKHRTKEDQTMQTVIDLVRSCRWNSINQLQDPSVRKTDFNVFRNVSQQLTVADDFILKGNKSVLPETLRLIALDLAHTPGHMWLTKVKMLLREKVWFLYIDKQAKEMIDKCPPCQAAGPGKPPAPLKPSELPPSAWHTLKADFLGTIPGTHQPQNLLVIIDCYSRFPEVEILSSTSANTIIPKFDRIFATQGIPVKIKTDNGPPFQSEQIDRYMKDMGERH